MKILKSIIFILTVISMNLIICSETVLSAEKSKNITGSEILKNIDQNLYSDTKKVNSRMVVINRRGRKRTMKLVSYMEGDKKAFSEYLAPKKEKGTKMLKVDKSIWTYTPRTDRVIHIAGHLLRQSIMGSDLSYEDSMEERKLSENYKSVIEKEEKFLERSVYVLKLTARFDTLAYQTRKLWVDKEKFLPLKEELYGKSGKLLKTTSAKEIKKIQNRWYPVRILYKDELKSGEGTELIMDEIEFNPEIPSNIFTKQSLRK